MHVQDSAAHLIAGGSKEKRSNRLLTIALDEFYPKNQRYQKRRTRVHRL